MKLVVAWLAAISLVVVFSASSCSINHRSGDYTCTVQADCDNGRQCVEGLCVLPGGTMIDAPRGDAPRTDASIDAPMIDAAMCPPQCTSCNMANKTCTIDCSVTNCTNAQIVCPSEWNCAIGCTTNNACSMGINCNNAKSCAINCAGQSSCRNVQCGTGDCNVMCTGNNSCRNINCSNSCACDVSCSMSSLCDLLTCSDVTCDPLGRGCSSQLPNCDTCP